MINVDIVCPVYKNINYIKRFCDNLKYQKNVKIKNVIFPHTLCDDNKIDDEIEKILSCYKTFILEKKDFSHSLTREKAVREFCSSNIVIFMSQDVILYDEYSLYNLAKVIDDEIIYAYGRQICKEKSIEMYIREKNYGKESIIVDKSMIKKMQIMAFFSSDAFSAINRNKFLEIGGYNDYNVMMNEDQLYSKFVLDYNYKKMYVSNAIVIHSHKYTFKQLYDRYYETGKFYKTVNIFNEYKTTDSGLKLALYVLKRAIKNFDIVSLIRWLPDMMVRYFGMKKGKNSNGKNR